MTIEFDGQNNKLGTTTADSVTIKTNDTDALSINSDGDFLIGKSDTTIAADDGFAVAGVGAINTGQTNIVVDGGIPLRINRLTDDGSLVEFRKDGTVTGRINTTATGLSMFLGGNASANELDDYEEGTWTPSFEFGVSQPTAGNTTGTGLYTKVGNMVTVWGTVRNVNVTGASGDVKIRDLPFTSKAEQTLVGYMGTFSVGSVTHSGYLNCDVEENTSTIRPLENISGAGGRDILNVANCSDGATDAYFCVSYQVN